MEGTKRRGQSSRRPIPAIIAMKGHPCTGKSRYGVHIAALLEYLVVSLDGICSCSSSLEEFLDSFPEAIAATLDDLSFEIACQAALTHLRQNFGVVIDSPLSCESQFLRLKELSKAANVPLVVVECKASDEYEWRSWIEGRAARGTNTTKGAAYPYKPSTWDELEHHLEFNKGISDYKMEDVSTLFIHNSAGYFDVLRLFSTMKELVRSKNVRHVELPSRTPEKYEGQTSVVYEGQQSQLEIGEVDEIYTRLDFLKFSFNWRKEGESAQFCGKCQKPVSGKIYNCNEFKILLHKSCAESPHPQNLIIFPGDDIPYLEGNGPEVSLKDVQRSNNCNDYFHKQLGRKFCGQCLFRAHLRSGLLPTVVHHVGHKHPLMLRLYMDQLTYICDACGDNVKYIWYFCDKCTFHCHVKCLFSPVTIKNKYHLHSLSRKCFPENDDSEEQICDACQEHRNSKYWIYKCDHCNGFACHLNCPTLLEPAS